MTEKTLREGADSVEAVASRTAAENESHSQHSPLPWRLDPDLENIGKAGVTTANGIEFAVNDGYEPGYMQHADAAFIVRCVNSHDDLLAALKAFFEKWPEVERVVNGYIGLHFARTHAQYTGPNLAAELDAMRAAIAKAEGR